MTTHDELLNRGLPKWPQMYTTGKRITEEQSKEIIRRTDSFFVNGAGGNDHKFDSKWAKAFGMRHFYDYSVPYDERKTVDWKLNHNIREVWNAKWGTLGLNYCENHWISSSYIYGPYGWCHPWDGIINYVDNVGKWPSVEDIYNEWVTIAKAFPFLDIGVTLMNDEHCIDGTAPVVSLKVSSGEVTLVDPHEHDVHKDHEVIKRSRKADQMTIGMRSEDREHGIRMDWMSEWAEFAKKEVIPMIDDFVKNWVPE